ncbi:hypothetical protein NA56DRAFT_741095 [Hyaloscypha hepaticicola]|uniref:Xylanolytic transcriptional activator regulatory domain-containing protein n=1 Tax=Hyaloscypha hepaticicola TaxID=2082293 RepID=A0A2J6QE72_9HELO|nr:hypothetical protein NA56DRAFT_741095 [Hyaloscypha hepaticicola]
MYLADRTAMELSDIFHGSLVTLSRRLGLFEMTYNNMRAASVSSDRLESQNSVQQESAKRLAYFVFALDVEHALSFGHERSIISIYSMKLELPIEEEEQTKRNGPVFRTKFHLLCHNLLSNPQSHTTIPSNLTQLSNLIILLGLASVVLDLLRRQPDLFFDTKQALSHLGVVRPAIHSRIIAGPEGSMKVHGRTVYYITAISLCTPLEDLERAANDGFSRTGLTPKHHTRAAIIRLLTKHKVGAEHARHAIQLLRLYMIPLSNLEAHSNQSADDYMPAPNTALPASYSRYEPSALYFGVLTLWAYIIGRLSDDDGDDSQLGEHSYSPDVNLEPQRVTSSSSPLRTSIAALLQGMEAAINNDDSLACRTQWRTIVQHATAFLALRNNNAQEYSQVLSSLSDVISV